MNADASHMRAPRAEIVEKPVVVLKFGSSVLSGPEDLPAIVSEIYRVVRTDRRVVAVTSAFLGMTDALLAESDDWGAPHDNINAPAYVATGEELSAALTALACDQAGLSSVALKAPEVGILAQGPWREAEPIALCSAPLSRSLALHDVVCVPGFVATGEHGRTVLLGRGGSDLTAIFLAHALKAERVRLVKDVDGVYEEDPAIRSGARRYRRIDWRHAREVAGALIQPRALEFAERNDVAFEVGAIGSDDVTLVSAHAAPPAPRLARRRLRVALAGLGVVGQGVAERLLQRSKDFEIVAAFVRDPDRPREVELGAGIVSTQPDALFTRGADVIVDMLSCAETGAMITEAALATDIDVVSANKQALVSVLFDAPPRAVPGARARLACSAAVGGGAPLLETVANARAAGATVEEIAGIFNGTVNFVLEQLALRASLEEALERAQKAGLAEADASADLLGHDAVAKLKLLSFAAFGEAPTDARIVVEPLDSRCAERARTTRLKQVATLLRQGSELSAVVAYEPADPGPFANVRGDRNAIRVTAHDGRVWTASGRGAGRWPTTESVIADLVDLSMTRGPVRI